MKKFIYLIGISFVFCILLNLPIISFAADTPYYDSTYNNNNGALYANGTPITIEKDGENTVVKWLEGSKIITNTVTIFGGGTKGKTYSSSNITMEDGEVYSIVGGGVSTDKNNSSNVENVTITINGGEVTGNVVGGGYIYSQVENSKITINNGSIVGITGGGFASLMIDNQMYYAGTVDNPKESGNRVNNVDITINNITMPPERFPSGVVYAGGQSYAYVGETSLTINGGSLSKAYVTAGGLDGYTKNATVTITNGLIDVYQSIKKGTLESVNLKVTGGTLKSLYVGAETGDSTASGTINSAKVELLGGTIEFLAPGKSNSKPLEIDKEKYMVLLADMATILKNTIPESGQTHLTYDLLVFPNELDILKSNSEKINTSITTKPAGYEYLFTDNKITWESNNTNIATVSDEGIVTGINIGTTEIKASFLDKTETVTVRIISSPRVIALVIILSLISLIVIIISIFV